MNQCFDRIAAACAMLFLSFAASAQGSTTFTYGGRSQSIHPDYGNDAELLLYVDGVGTLTDLDLRFDALPGCDATPSDTDAAIAHTAVGELTITLVSPTNTELVVIDNRGGTRENICQTLLDDDGGFPTLGTLTSVSGQSVSGSFRPDNALSVFDGEPPNGFWKLRIVDGTGGESNVGMAYRWSLIVRGNPVPEIVVDRLDDPAPDGCTPGSCSLREAVSMANARVGLDRIRLPAGTLQLTRAGAGERLNLTGDLNVLEGLEIVGAGATQTTLRQTTPDRLLYAEFDRDLTLRNLRIEGGRDAIFGGAVYAFGKLLIEDAAFADNRAVRQGGAVYHRGGGLNDPVRPQVTIRRVEFDTNEVGPAAAGVPTVGGALYVSGATYPGFYAAQVEASSFVRNRATQGGGAIAFDNEPVVQPLNQYSVIDSEFIDNRVTEVGHGGAIGVNFGGGGLTETQILRSLFLGNSVSALDGQNAGGALWVRDGAVGTTLTIVRDSTFCDNVAQAAGGAVFLQDEGAIAGSTFCDNLVRTADTTRLGGGAVALDHGGLEVVRSTFEGNSARRGGAITIDSGDYLIRNSTFMPPTGAQPVGTLGTILRFNGAADEAVSTLVYDNILGGTCSFLDLDTVFDNARNNIEDNNTCRLARATADGDNQVNAVASALALQPLGDNGGPTETRLPGPGSIAIDKGTNTYCPNADQRGFLRTDATCDVGAVEVSAVPPTTALFANGFEG